MVGKTNRQTSHTKLNGQAYQNGLFYPYLAVSFCYFRLFNINAVVLDAFDVA